MENVILHTNGLQIGYQSKKSTRVIASDIDLALSSGRLVALIGANGIGKSTLLRTITGIQKPLSGDVTLHRQPVHAYTSSQLAQKISIVLTEKLPPSNLTVFDLVALGRQPYTNWIGQLTPDDVHAVYHAMDLVQIRPLSMKKHYEISDGQLQKVLIARALAQDTPLIILDEPTTHLDLYHKASLFQLLAKLTSETNKTILFSTHDIEMALQLADEIIVMTPNEIHQGEPQALINSGILNKLFADDNVAFDPVSQKFVFKNF